MKDPIAEFQGFNITFNTGEACNLACKYCYEVNKKQTKLPLEYAQKFIDLILSEEDPIGVVDTDHEWILRNGLILDFIGGDSLMFPDLVDSILQYYIKRAHLTNHRWKDNWRASIATNGTLFEDPKVRALIEKYQQVLSISISIDGCPEIHDKNRTFLDGTGSMEVIKKNLPWFKSVVGAARFSTKSTLNKDSIPYLYDSLVYMHKELGISIINQNFIFEDMHLTSEDLQELESQMEKCVEYVLQQNDTLYWSMIDKRFVDAVSFEQNCREHPNTGWCGSGAMPALAVDGKIYPCFRFLPHTQGAGYDMSVGDIWEGIVRKENFACIRSLTRERISETKCRECGIESACSWCIAGSFSEKGAGYRQTYICEPTKIQAKWAKVYWDKRGNK